MLITGAREHVHLDSWRAILQKTDRIVSEEPVIVHIEEAPSGMKDIAGWSDGLNIYLNEAMLKATIRDADPLTAVLRLKGLNYHELCHVLYTPRSTDDLVRTVLDKVNAGDSTWMYAFNALEDQRIETWFTAKYTASRRYFEATILEWIIKEGTAETAALLYGRKYLEPSIRVQAGTVFMKKYGQALYDEFKTVIDEYILLVLPTDSVRAFQLITKYHELLGKMQGAHSAPLPRLVIEDNGSSSHNGGKSDPSMKRKGRVLVKQARRDRDNAADKVEDAIDADIEEEARRAAAKQGKGDPSDEEPKDGLGSGKGDEEGSDGADDGDDGSQDGPPHDGEDGGGKQAGTGSMENHTSETDEPSLEEEMRALIEEAADGMDDIHEDPAILSDVDSVLDAVKAAENNGRMNAQGKAVKATSFEPDDETKMAVRRVQNILLRIRQEAEPETLRKQYAGRIDPKRVIARSSHEVDIFRKWDSGSEDETGVEAVILFDVSGSMSGMLRESASAVWVMKRAFDKLDIRTTVLLYDTQHSVLYQPGEKAGPNVPHIKDGGGTDPTSALVQAQRILMKSQSPNRVLISVTDGGWGGSEEVRLKMMKQMHRSGVKSLILGIDSAVSGYGTHGHLEGHDMSSVKDLPKAVTKLVATIMRSISV